MLNPFLNLAPGVTPASILSNSALPYEVRYQTGNLSTWSIGPANLNVAHTHGAPGLIPGQTFYVDVLGFTATTLGLYETQLSWHREVPGHALVYGEYALSRGLGRKQFVEPLANRRVTQTSRSRGLVPAPLTAVLLISCRGPQAEYIPTPGRVWHRSAFHP